MEEFSHKYNIEKTKNFFMNEGIWPKCGLGKRICAKTGYLTHCVSAMWFSRCVLLGLGFERIFLEEKNFFLSCFSWHKDVFRADKTAKYLSERSELHCYS